MTCHSPYQVWGRLCESRNPGPSSRHSTVEFYAALSLMIYNTFKPSPSSSRSALSRGQVFRDSLEAATALGTSLTGGVIMTADLWRHQIRYYRILTNAATFLRNDPETVTPSAGSKPVRPAMSRPCQRARLMTLALRGLFISDIFCSPARSNSTDFKTASYFSFFSCILLLIVSRETFFDKKTF
jgi:hypothetical protein